jgi:hypothetical protein
MAAETEKRTSITTVWDQYLSFAASFPAPLVSQWSLPLRSFNFPCEDQKKKFTKVFLKLFLLNKFTLPLLNRNTDETTSLLLTGP